MTTDSDVPHDVHNTAVPPLSNWLLSWQIQAVSPPKLYGNARQQVVVVITLEPRRDEIITDDELESLKLVLRCDDGSFEDVPMEDTLDALWFASGVQNHYQYYPETQIGMPVYEDGGPLPGAVRTKRFYVQTRTRAGTNMQLWSSITRQVPEGEKYEYISDGSQQGFNTSITLGSVTIPTYNAPADYTFDRRLVGGQENSDLFIWEYYIAPAHALYPEVAFLSAQATTRGMIQWATFSGTQTRAGHAGFAAPANATIHYNNAIVLGPNFVPVEKTRDLPGGLVTVVLQGGNNIPFHPASAQSHKGPMVIQAIDHYGNEHVLRVRFESELPTGRANLVLSRA